MNYGVAAFVIKDNQILLGKRGKRCKRHPGLIALPGGHLELNESIVNCAIREVEEETGLITQGFFGPSYIDGNILGVSEVFEPGYCSTTYWVALAYRSGSVEIKEPDKCDWWNWYTLDQVKEIPDVLVKGSLQYTWIPYHEWTKILVPKVLNWVDIYGTQY